MRVADADDPTVIEDDQAERPADAGQDALQGFDRVRGRFVGEERRQELRVGRGRQAGAAAGEHMRRFTVITIALTSIIAFLVGLILAGQFTPSTVVTTAPRYTPEDFALCMPRYTVERARLLRNGMQEFLFRL